MFKKSNDFSRFGRLPGTNGLISGETMPPFREDHVPGARYEKALEISKTSFQMRLDSKEFPLRVKKIM